MKQPWSKFFWSDWRSDPRLRMCGLAARGLWMEMLALMHESEPYGHLLVNGNAPTNDELAVLAGAPPSHLPDLLGELERVGVFSRTRKGVIYSRRMLRDEKKAETAKKNGAKGGNPTLCKDEEIPPSDKGDDKPHIPEARSQKQKEKIYKGDFDRFWEAYPRRVAKAAAFKAYIRARQSGATEKQLLDGIEFYRRNKPEYADWCHASTWLHQERWLDEAPAPPANAGTPEAPQYSEPWPQRVAAWRKGLKWDIGHWGPPPGSPGCRCPAELLKEAA